MFGWSDADAVDAVDGTDGTDAVKRLKLKPKLKLLMMMTLTERTTCARHCSLPVQLQMTGDSIFESCE